MLPSFGSAYAHHSPCVHLCFYSLRNFALNTNPWATSFFAKETGDYSTHQNNFLKIHRRFLSFSPALFSAGLSIFWSQASTRGFSLHDVVRVMCEEPAKLSRLSHRKGKIAVGMDADFVLWDPEEAVVVKAKSFKFSYFCIMLTSL